MDTIPVTLIVKAPNQQFEDQTIKCELSWTIKKLKGYLSEVYPCKPSTDEQKLIYSGQLLHDAIILKDILRQYEGQETHTVHLVFTPKSKALPSVNKIENNKISSETIGTQIENDGLRQRNVGLLNSNMENTTNIPLRNATGNPYFQQTNQTILAATNCLNPSGLPNNNLPMQQPNEYMMAHQIAMQNWMQQAYMQYINQYMSLMSMGVRPEAVYMEQSQVNIGNSPLLLQNTNTHVVDNQPQVQAQQDNIEQPVQNQAQPRFPIIVHEEVPENRDWLDMLYTSTRVLVLLTLIYFYSSPLRCMIVFSIGSFIYLYHMIVFRGILAEANNNVRHQPNIAQNPVAPVAAAPVPVEPNDAIANHEPNDVTLNDNIPPNQENQSDNTDVLPSEPESSTPTPTTVENSAESTSLIQESNDANNNNRIPTIAFIRTLVLSFFASLIPETPAL